MSSIFSNNSIEHQILEILTKINYQNGRVNLEEIVNILKI